MTEIERLAQIVSDWLQADVTATDCPGIVRAILTAMREPSEGMLSAAEQGWQDAADDWRDPWRKCWQDIINHMLNEPAVPVAPLDPDLQDELGHHGPKDRDRK